MRATRAMSAGLLVSSVLILGCGGGGGSSPTEPAQRDSLALLSVQPAAGTHAQIGGKIHMVARLRYTFEKPAGGEIAVLVYPLPIGLPLVTNPEPAKVQVQGQEGEVTFPLDILLDEALIELRPGPIAVDFALFPEGQTRSTVSVQVRYELVR
ncbi:MAG TPA: hypothetical protein VH394_15385 [Thermoanaerobaculia bacterium]|nr:hypothetical protein [Thermoanaerobaculia bacterium]